MHMRVQAVSLMVATLALPSLVACSQLGNLKARKAFKEANQLYQQQDYKKAAAKYEETIQADPAMTQAYFYLGNSYDNQFKPTRKGEPENDASLTKAIENYTLASEKAADPGIRKLALQYLVAAYGTDKLNDPTKAEPLVQRMIEIDPSDPANYFALMKIYEDAGQYDQAEAIMLKAREARPNDATVYVTLAGYYNRQGQFDKTIEALEQRAQKEPNNPEAFYTIASFYWDKTYRDFRLKEPEKMAMIRKGLDAVDRALAIRSDYTEAVVYKGLLLRLQANVEKDPGKQQALIREATQLQDRAKELQKKKVAGVSD